jgi:hypothetical protein
MSLCTAKDERNMYARRVAPEFDSLSRTSIPLAVYEGAEVELQKWANLKDITSSDSRALIAAMPSTMGLVRLKTNPGGALVAR